MTTIKFRDPADNQWKPLLVGTQGGDHGLLVGLGDDDHPQYLKLTGGTMTGVLTVPYNGLAIKDQDGSHGHYFAFPDNITQVRQFSIFTGDASRSLTMSADVALNQNLRTTDSPTFAQVSLSGGKFRGTATDDYTLQAQDLSGSGPLMNGWVVKGYTGIGFLQGNSGVWRWGFRGAAANPYFWINGRMVIGSLPSDDVANAAQMFVEGGTKTRGLVEGVKNGGSQYHEAQFLAYPGYNGAGAPAQIAMFPGNFGNQWREAWNDPNQYIRNHADSGYYTFYCDVLDTSSGRYKQDVVNMRERVAGVALDRVRQLRPVFYRKRREQALLREDGTDHVCGEECGGSADDPCVIERQWRAGRLGFIAEEVHEVIPEVTEPNTNSAKDSDEYGAPEGIKTLGLVAVLTAAMQEMADTIDQLTARIAVLEG